MEVNMRLQQMLFAAFASSVLIIGCHESSKLMNISDVNSSIEMQSPMDDEAATELFMPDELLKGNTPLQYIKQVFTKLTAYFSFDQMKQEMRLIKQLTRLPHVGYHTSAFLNKLIQIDDLYPSSFKGLETFIKEEKIIIHGELKPINI